MITGKPIAVQSVPTEKNDWQHQLTEMIQDLSALLDACGLSEPPAPLANMLAVGFPVRTTRHFASLITPGDWHDPLLQQILPWATEQVDVPGFSADPLQEREASPLPGLIHKYRSRVLLVPTGSCAIHCRYCFRRHFPYEGHRMGAKERAAILDYLSAHPEVNEVIFSGGDPLMLNDRSMQNWLTSLAGISSLTTVRFHSRLPIVLPDRLTPEFQRLLTSTRLQTVLVLHSNHAQELPEVLAQPLNALRAAGVILLNQAVLLRGVNDNLMTQAELSQRLMQLGVLPYYLHQLDSVSGAAHFAVSDNEALLLHNQMKEQLAGYLVPRLVQEIPDRPSKTWLP
ncbi:EF-P beta-lysylation protein EpmB [Salinispirillum sp. LH 10-3-1]|uniref:L-lysine 2,3-aminomutase n=1 Tax=Salinispirillum sp. LH 10-3-1 TaxID=2952525 RepID=A0AB38YEH6_9GAMM